MSPSARMNVFRSFFSLAVPSDFLRTRCASSRSASDVSNSSCVLTRTILVGFGLSFVVLPFVVLPFVVFAICPSPRLSGRQSNAAQQRGECRPPSQLVESRIDLNPDHRG